MLDENEKIIVLDDDPTGTQTVHDVRVHTVWDVETLVAALQAPERMFFILTNSRSLSAEETAHLHRELAENILTAARVSHRRFLLISRGDSTLRGHFPLETQTLYDALGGGFDGELLIPAFFEGGRFTKENVHYAIQNGRAIPAGETEFARDATFGYHSSDLRQWVEEKSGGRIPRGHCLSLSPEDGDEALYQKLLSAQNFQKIIVNVTNYGELNKVVAALERALAHGKKYLYRTAASFPKALASVSDRPLLRREQLLLPGERNGGLIVVGSHVHKTTEQLNRLLDGVPGVDAVLFHSELALTPALLAEESARVRRRMDESIAQGRLTVVYTQRKRLEPPGENEERQLACSVRISQALTAAVGGLRNRPGYLVAKGGITSSDVATHALRIRSAWVLGQIQPGVPVWLSGSESKFPGMPYVIFPGNVGDQDTLLTIARELA